MKAPSALVRDVHARFALARGRHQRAIHVDRGLGEERLGLPRPDLPAHVVKHLLQRLDLMRMKAATEIAGRRRIGNPASVQRIEQGFILSPQFQIFQACAAAQRVVRQVQHVIRLVIRQMHFQQVQSPVDRFGQPQFAHQTVDRSDSAACRAGRPFGQFVMDVASPEHGLRRVAQIPTIQAFDVAVLAALDLPA